MSSLDKRHRDHAREQLRGLGGLAVDGDTGVVQPDLGGPLRHGRGDQAEGLAEELPGDVEIGPGIEDRHPGQRRLDAQVHQLPGVLIRAPDSLVDPLLPQPADPLGRQEQAVLILHHLDVDPFEIGVVVGPGPLRQRRGVLRDVARLGDVLHLVRQAVEIAEDLAQQAAADLVPQHLRRQADRLAERGAGQRAYHQNRLEDHRCLRFMEPSPYERTSP